MATAFQLDARGLQRVLDLLNTRGYTTIGPTVAASAIVLEPVASIEDLPRGWSDRQAPGRYKLVRTGSTGFFQYTCGPHPWKRYLTPPEQLLWRSTRHNGKIRSHTPEPGPGPYAFVGMRPCDLRALDILDRVLSEQAYTDPAYTRARDSLFTIVVNCLEPGGTCFCTATGGGPRADSGFDIALSEIVETDRCVLVAEPGSRPGAEVLAAACRDPATHEKIERIRLLADQAAARLNHMPDLTKMGPLFQGRFDGPHWQTLESRCLACGNCTMVCPTCFCHTVIDSGSLDGSQAERLRVQDSCFNMAFSYIHGGSVRPSVSSRYRQWFLHKLATWQDQFKTPGCVGCGRCITWCPAGIDLRREALVLAGGEEERS